MGNLAENDLRERWRGFVFATIGGGDCCLCGRALAGEKHPLCAACAEDLPRHDDSACPRCALPTACGEVCGDCRREPPAFDATRAAFDYAFPLDVLVKRLKYGHRLAMADFFAAALGETPAVDLILPMPLHPRRLRERGFNQAVEIARPLARAAALPLELAGVARVRDTPPQARLDLEARLANLRDAFACRRRLDGLRVAVVDDVMTTGASLDALARCLKENGAKEVTNLVVARTPR
ncbi:MAG: ComF family protein [Azoarcus sp.]|nr:ComF family protein [Azoarcus sp.]